MEGGGGGGFGYGNLQNNLPLLYRPSPPLTAIDRFLWSQNHFSQQVSQNCMKNKQTLVSANGFGDFSSSSGAIDSYAGGVSWPSLQEMSFVDGLFLDGETLNWTHERNPNVGLREVVKSVEKSSRGLGKRAKGGSSATLIKGQWTDEEDRTLVRLVKQYGIRKWAQIAEKLVGRAGKQCRERWHNHLRPDIKKDTWSEEEERLLIEVHEKVGNRWAEIAKRIRGRTENAIKNHWNATKRRQNSRRKSKKTDSESGKSQSSVLQDYIKSKNLNDTSTPITPTQSTTTTSTPTASTLSEDPSNQFDVFLLEPSESTIDDSSPLITHTYDDELLFMQKFFGNNHNQTSADNARIMGSIGEVETFHIDPHKDSLDFNSLDVYQTNGGQQLTEIADSGFFSSSTPNPNIYTNNFQKEEISTTHLYSDLYISYLLNGATSSSSVNCYDNTMMDFLTDQASSKGKKEMDLIEMVSASQRFSQTSNCSFRF